MKLRDKRLREQKIEDFYNPDYNEPMTLGEFIEGCLGCIAIGMLMFSLSFL